MASDIAAKKMTWNWNRREASEISPWIGYGELAGRILQRRAVVAG
jgi:hypothetical protein